MSRKILVLDTETASLDRSVYDVGFTVTDRSGKIHHEDGWLVREVVTNPKIMMGAFYAGKIFSHYVPALDEQKIRVKDWAYIVDQINTVIADYNIETIAAYNLGFDSRVMGGTHKDLGNTGKVLERKLNMLDLWQFACEAKLNTNKYRKVATEQGWVTPAGNIRTGAEFAYRYIFDDHNFIESHTALHDAQIETEIMQKCFQTKKKIPYGIINAHPWRIVNRAA